MLTGRMKALARVRPKDLIPITPAIAEPSTGETMGQSAEKMAKLNSISRDEHVADLGNGITEVLMQASPTAVASVAQRTCLMMAGAFKLHRLAYGTSPEGGC